jgi:hypothetical protein
MTPAEDRGTVAGWAESSIPALLVDVTLAAIAAGRDDRRDRRVALAAYSGPAAG